MELDVSTAFLKPAEPFPFEAEVSLEPQDVNGETVAFDPVKVEGSFYVLDDAVRLEGELQTVAHGTCALCLERADAPVVVSFSETFRKDANETEDECFRYEGKAVPLDHMTLTLVMLNLPMRFVCKAGCQGGPELRAWRNEEALSPDAEGPRTRRPFEALQSLLDEEAGASAETPAKGSPKGE